ncbi:MAG: DUF3093 domain-containing protein [Rhodoluna sp.]|nr:DUF3093 domain-containing protein [Rhodoluna sp.]MBP6186217.1 DUF3093 domain-containing protein [Rhodoluna sp.]
MPNTAEGNWLYKEFQVANLTSFLPNLLIAPSVWLVFAPINADLGLILSIVLTVASIALRLATTKTIVLTNEELRIGKATLPRTVLAHALSIEPEAQFAERGPKLDSRAFLALKSGLPGLVKIAVSDQQDPTPYILVSTRRADEIVELLNA